jgi:hypothetical protein
MDAARSVQKGWGRACCWYWPYGLVVFTTLLYANDFATAGHAVSDFAKNGVITILLALLISKPIYVQRRMWTIVAAGYFYRHNQRLPIYDRQFLPMRLAVLDRRRFSILSPAWTISAFLARSATQISTPRFWWSLFQLLFTS